MSAGSGLRREEDPMGLFTPRPLCPQAQLAEDELKKDLAGAKAFGAVRLGEKALYLPGIPARRYVPLPWVQRVWLRMMEASVQGEFIQPLLVVTYPGGQVQIEVEHRREVDQLLEALKAQPGLPLGREYPAPRAVTVAQMKELERRADAAGLPYRQMMENAGCMAARLALGQWPAARTAAVLCGRGNNGGDGFVAARWLANAGLAVRIYLLEGEPVTPDAIHNLALARQMGLEVLNLTGEALPEEQEHFLRRAELCFDGLYGTGYRFDPARPGVQGLLGRCAGKRVALDLPSGLEADTGADHTDAPADLTVAFHAPKACHALAAQRCGKLALADIGIRRVLTPPAEL